jgi:DNA-binding NtrC family response regulator
MTMTKQAQVLFVEDDEATIFAYRKFFDNSGYKFYSGSSLAEARVIVRSVALDAIILDLQLSDGNALDWIPDLRANYPRVPVIVISGVKDLPVAIAATKYGAENYLTKPVEMEEVRRTLEQTLEASSQRSYDHGNQKKRDVYFGESRAISTLLGLARMAAASDAALLLLGETGTGKGVLARWIHEQSRRSAEPFVELNCSSMRGDLLRSELFGHVKGAFTSSVRDKEGLFEIADKGTLFPADRRQPCSFEQFQIDLRNQP